jgi:hypothetical protein
MNVGIASTVTVRLRAREGLVDIVDDSRELVFVKLVETGGSVAFLALIDQASAPSSSLVCVSLSSESASLSSTSTPTGLSASSPPPCLSPVPVWLPTSPEARRISFHSCVVGVSMTRCCCDAPPARCPP